MVMGEERVAWVASQESPVSTVSEPTSELGVSCEGKFNLRKGGISNWTDVITAKANSAILVGANKTNRLGVMVKGTQIAIYLNGKLVDSVTDSTYSNPGTFGMFIVGWNPGFAYETEEILYWELP